MPLSRSFVYFVLAATIGGLVPTAGSAAARKYWIYLADKGAGIPSFSSLAAAPAAYSSAMAELDPRAIARRAKVLPPNALVTSADLPLEPSYLTALNAAGVTILQESRWLNAVSAVLTDAQKSVIAALPFVQRIEPVRGFRHRSEPSVGKGRPMGRSAMSFDYGSSITQLALIDVPPLHSMGVTGKGVLVGMLDSGFRWRAHDALKTRSVLDEYDFVFHDDTTSNQPGDIPSQDEHGTLTMSLIGGYAPGTLLGCAFDVSFLLAKTEDIRSETEIEEDNWAAGIEWMERKGVDVVSSSLGYNVFDDGTGYTWANGDFNGRTSVTAKAALRAAELGVVVCNAMGNEGNGDGIAGMMLTPADADSILSVGAVDFTGTLEPFSSTGPTNDGRIKPDFVAPGSRGMVVAVPPNDYSIGFQGTSLATPLVAGTAALLLSVRPELTPIALRDALRSSAAAVDTVNFPLRPNNYTGWGMPDAFRTAASLGPIFSNTPNVSTQGTGNRVTIDVASAYGILPDSVILHVTTGRSRTFIPVTMSLDSAMFFQTSGRYAGTLPAFSQDTLVRFYVDAVDSSGRRYRSPAAATGKDWEVRYGKPGVHISPDIPSQYALSQNYPNPVNGWTTIEFNLPFDEYASIDLFDSRGAHVASLVSGWMEAGTRHTVRFDASLYASGVYFYSLRTPRTMLSRKLIILR